MSSCKNSSENVARSKKPSSPASSVPNRKHHTSPTSEKSSDYFSRGNSSKGSTTSSNNKARNNSVFKKGDSKSKENKQMMSKPSNIDQANKLSCSSLMQEQALDACKPSSLGGSHLEQEEKENSQALPCDKTDVETNETYCCPSKKSTNAMDNVLFEAKDTVSPCSPDACGKPLSHSSVLASPQSTVQEKGEFDKECSACSTRDRLSREKPKEVVDLCYSSDEE
jgi:hypothetical protein